MLRILRRSEENDCHLAYVEVEELRLLMRHVACKVPPDTTVPQHAVILLLKMLLDARCDLLLVRLGLHGLLRHSNDFVLHLRLHRRRLDHWLDVRASHTCSRDLGFCSISRPFTSTRLDRNVCYDASSFSTPHQLATTNEWNTC